MPSEQRIPTEPSLEELSAYLDHELDPAAQARVAEHVAGCVECTRRLDALRETVHAVRALPMETPPRTFTIPEQRRQPFRWAPVGWLGGAAAALLVIAFGVSQWHGPAGGSAVTTAGSQYGAAAPYGQVAPLSRSNDYAPSLAQRAASTNAKTVVDPQDSSRALTVGTDATSYSAHGVMTVHVTTRGLSAAEASSVKLFLSRENGQAGYAVRLIPPSNATTYPFDWEAAYSISQMALRDPVAGTYQLQVTIDLSNHQSLTTWLPVTITP
jgi:predicted anti-sigma-YlaC factor YlaD